MISNRWSFSRTALSAAVALVVAAPVMAQSSAAAGDEAVPRPKDDKVRLGTIVIVGEGNKLGAGQMLNEDAVKGRSTVTKAATEKDRATGNPFQALALLPGINTFNYDATGLFGGGLTVRGFGADQLGLTINGVPVNDSGNFAVYPQEYADQENLCTQTVAQGNPDVESPHAGATGGSVGITSCDPEDKRRVRIAQTIGGLNLSRTFVRLDTGRFSDDKAKVFVSYSHTEADKWKGSGGAKKDHLDAAFRVDLSDDNKVLGSLLYNRAINNNFYSVSLSQLASNGYYYDFAPTFVGHLPAVNGTVQKEVSTTPGYYNLSQNPFENAIASVSGSFKLAENTYLKVQPYFWYGFGNGALQQQTALSETAFLNTTTGKIGAGVDLNGDRDTLDTVIVARGSVTKTSRPGITAEINKTVGDHQLRLGVWYERASHRQTQPAVPVDANGNYAIWLDEGQIKRPDGSLYQGRDWETVSTAYQAYASDAISFMGDRGLLSFGLRTPHVQRDVTNNANEGGLVAYNMKRSYSDVLPQVGVRFNLDRSQQVFMNVGKNFRAAPNFAFTGNNVRLNSAGVVELVTEAMPETSIMTDLGYRLQTRAFSLSATFFNSDFKNRQSNAYDPVADKSTYTNAGRVNNRGLEFEVGSGNFGGFTAYGSLTVQRSELKDDITVAKGQTLPTSGKQFSLTPQRMLGASLQYAEGPFYARVKVKHTGRAFATLMNDEEVPAYTVGDFDAGYNFGKVGFMDNTQLRFNISNIGNVQYRNPSSGSVVNAVKVGSTNPGTVYYYLGAPRFVSLSLSADFN